MKSMFSVQVCIQAVGWRLDVTVGFTLKGGVNVI